jgi:uncharacterized membrane protein YphA (DoxX/SURF4 family)
LNVLIWVLQVVLALGFLAAGIMKTTQPREKLMTRMAYVEDLSDGGVRAIGLLEILAALGLILPAISGVAPVLTPLAAVGICVVMVGAAITHLRRNEAQAIPVNLVLFALAALVAFARFGPYSL